MEFDKTRWSCSWNNDQNYTKLYQEMGTEGGGGVRGEGSRGGGVQGVRDLEVVRWRI